MNKQLAIIIHTDGSFTLHEKFDNSNLSSLQEVVGGLIETVPLTKRTMDLIEARYGFALSNDAVGVVNEEGIMLNLPHNRLASWMLNCEIFGDLLITVVE